LSTVAITTAIDDSLFPPVEGRFAERTVLVTGAAGAGMGAAAARAFAAEGARVYVVDRDPDAVAASVKRIVAAGGAAAGAAADVRSRREVEAALEACERTLGPLDVLINHAGIGPSQHTLELDEAAWREVVEINLGGVFRVAQSSARRMIARGAGVIVNMSSSGGIATEPGHAHYAASKAGILALTRAMAYDLGGRGVRVHAVCPGDVASYAWDNVELARLYRSRIAAGRSAAIREIVAVYLHLASDDARHLNGTAFVVDGGMLAWE
jgi:NAD(P)-dependent dehydrogenase (short-subunit alcohol dehydrogenase family)